MMILFWLVLGIAAVLMGMILLRGGSGQKNEISSRATKMLQVDQAAVLKRSRNVKLTRSEARQWLNDFLERQQN